MSGEEHEGCAACRLSEMTGRPHEEFETDAEIPDLGEQELLIPDGGQPAESERRDHQLVSTDVDGITPADALKRVEVGDEVRLEFDVLQPASAGQMGSYTALTNVEEAIESDETERIVRRKLTLCGHNQKFLTIVLSALYDRESEMCNVCREAKYAGKHDNRMNEGRIDVRSVEVEKA